MYTTQPATRRGTQQQLRHAELIATSVEMMRDVTDRVVRRLSEGASRADVHADLYAIDRCAATVRQGLERMGAKRCHA